MAQPEDLSNVSTDLALFKEDSLVQDALSKGVDLRHYAKELESELNDVTHAHIEDYLKEAEDLINLHKQIQTCDGILANMESLLTGFQSDLGSISEEIKVLQENSLTMNIKLRNRRALHSKMLGFLTDCAVSPELIHDICEAKVDEEYAAFLADLDHRIHAASKYGDDVLAIREIMPELNKLKHKASERIREYMLTKIQGLRKPKTNIQIVQTSVLLKMKYLMQFLRTHNEPVFMEIVDLYCDTLSRIYVNHIKTYASSLYKLVSVVKFDLLDDPEKSKAASVVSLGERVDVLDASQLDTPALVPHTIKTKLSLEVAFRSVNLVLLDLVSSEFLFLIDFFGQARDIFHRIFENVYREYLDLTSSKISSCNDPLALLLVIRITNNHKRLMMRRRVPVADNVLDSLTMILWPRLKSLFDVQINTLRSSVARKLTSTLPHYLSRRYAEFAAAINAIGTLDMQQVRSVTSSSSPTTAMNVIDSGMETLNVAMQRLRHEFESLLIRLAGMFDDERGLQFLINNYDVVVSSCEVPCASGGGGDQKNSLDAERFSDLLKDSVVSYAREVVSKRFKNMVTLLKKLEPLIDNLKKTDETQSAADREAIRRRFIEAKGVVDGVTSSWRTELDGVCRDSLECFSNFHISLDVVQAIFTHFAVTYTRFSECLDMIFGHDHPTTKGLIPMQQLFFELKKRQQEVASLIEK